MSEEKVVLGGRYTLGKVLGTGGMAEVFLAEDSRLHRTVAVKVLRSDLARDANFQERFRREAHSAASLNHPSIVAVYDTGEEKQTTLTGAEVTIPYIVMEYVHGDTLREHIDPERPMDIHQAGEIMAALLSALEYSHRAGIVHRDIKPGNVMINDSGAVKVMDFGIARAVADATSAMTATQAVMGTAQYLSPEQARGQLVDARSDIYSAACVMYEMMTGRPPFTGDTPVSIAYQHVREHPQPPSAYNPAITPALDAVILTGLAKDREQRYPSAVAFSRDIAAVVGGRAPALVAGAEPVGAPGTDTAPTTVLSPMDDATEALPALAAAGVGGAGAGMAAANWRTGQNPSVSPGMSPHSPGEVEEEPRRKRPWWLIILVILAVLALAVAAIAIFKPFDRGPEMVPVPTVAGQTEDEARSILSDVGLDPTFETVQSQEVDKGLVIDTDPGEGDEVAVGSAVTVNVSAGPESVTVPEDLKGMTREEAQTAIEDAGLVMAEGDTEDAAQEQNTVTSTDPQSGAAVDKGSEVVVNLASGDVEVPDVEGVQFDKAKETLEARGFEVPDASEKEDAEADPGTVLSQTPKAANSPAPFGSRVDLVIAAAPGPVTVPNVTGQSLADAQKTLSDAGFGTEQTEEDSDSVPEGQVIRTEPGANESVERGSTVLIIVSSGPKETPSPSPTTPTEEPTETPTEDPTSDTPTDDPSSSDSEEPTDDPTDDDSGDDNANGNAEGAGKGRGAEDD